jgi:uncharacterized cupin superfamily protein
MANIVLKPGENFEHWHSHESETILNEGEVQLKFDSSLIDLEIGKMIKIPAHVKHVMVNTGKVLATVYCGSHGPVK